MQPRNKGKTTKKKSRTFRQAENIATEGGAVELKKRRLEDVAPVAKRRAEERRASGSVEFRNTLSAALLAKLAETHHVTLAKKQLKIAGIIASLPAVAEGQGGTTKQIVASNVLDRTMGVVLGVCELLQRRPHAHVLIVVRTDEVGEGLVERFSSLGVRPTVACSSMKAPPKAASHVAIGTLKAVSAFSKAFWRHYDVLCLNDPLPLIFDEENEPTTAEMAFLASSIHPSHSVVILGSGPDRVLSPHLKPIFERGKEESVCSSTFGLPGISYVVSQGVTRFQQLYSLLLHSSPTKRIVVHFATKESGAFYTELLYALKFDAAPFISDTEDQEVTPEEALAKFEARAGSKGHGCILFSSFGMFPTFGTMDVFVQFDPIVCLTEFPQTVANLCAQQQNSQPPIEEVILFFYPSEVQGAVALLSRTPFIVPHCGPTTSTLSMSRIVVTGGTAQTFVTTLKMHSLLKKIYTLNNKAFLAYRAHMLCYSQLHPRSIFDVNRLNVTLIAQQFGLEEAPLLDLRTKDTVFRPKEDIYKMATASMQKIKRATVKKATEQWLPEKDSDRESDYGSDGIPQPDSEPDEED